MKIFALFVACLSVIFFIVLPGIDEYNKHKDTSKKEATLYALLPLLVYIGLALTGFILFEIIPRIGAQIIEMMF